MIDSVESARHALDELIAQEGPYASLMHLFNTSEDEDIQVPDSEVKEEEGNSGSPISVAEVCMVGTPPPQQPPSAEYAARNEGERVQVTRNAERQEETTREVIRRSSVFRRLDIEEGSREPRQLTQEEQEEQEASERVLRTPIDISTPVGSSLEAARLTNLSERTRLAELQDTLEQQAREISQLKQSRTSRQLQNHEGEPFRAMDTPMENLIAATQIANSIQPSGSAAEGIQHLAFLLQKAVEQNAVVSQSLQRVHSQVPLAGTS